MTGYYAHLRLHLLLCNFSTSLIFIICLLERDFCEPEHINILDKFPFVSFDCVFSHSLKMNPPHKKKTITTTSHTITKRKKSHKARSDWPSSCAFFLNRHLIMIGLPLLSTPCKDRVTTTVYCDLLFRGSTAGKKTTIHDRWIEIHDLNI